MGINFTIDESNSLYVSYGRTGREPTRSDMLNGSDEEILSNVVSEEYVNDLELGWRYTSSKLSLSANLFYMDFQNEISKIGALQERSYMEVTQNVAQSTRSGLELQAMYQAHDNTTIHLNASYMNTNVETYQNGNITYNDVSQIFAPKWLIIPTIRHQFFEKFSALLAGRYASTSFMELSNNPDFIFPSYFILDSQIDYSISKNISISLFVNNISDKLYFTDGAPVDSDFDGLVEGPGYRVQPVRSVYIQFKCLF